MEPSLIELKAEMYDLLAQRQLIEQRMQEVNTKISEQSKPKPKEEPKAE